MLKVLIVDDEILVRVGLQACISWEEIGYEVVGTADNGQQALEMMQYLKPDLVFSDIRMPEMDGLELIHTLRENYPETKIIILSCLNDMEYVKQAIKLGAEDYILKLSLKADVLLEILKKLRIKLEKERNITEQRAEESHQMRYFMREQLYMRILSTTTFPDEKSMLLRSLDIPQAHNECFILCCCSIDDFKHAHQMSSIKEHYLLKFAILNIINEFLSDFTMHESVEIKAGEYLLLVRCKSEKAAINCLRDCHSRFNDAVKTHLNITTTWGVSSAFNYLDDLPVKWEQAKSALSLRFFNGLSSFITSDSMIIQSNSTSIDIDISSKLCHAVTICDKAEAERTVDAWASLARSIKGLLPSIVCAAAVEAWLSLSYLLRKQGFDEHDALPRNLQNPSLNFLQVETLDDICSYLKIIVFNCMDIITQNRMQRPEIANLKKYIAEHIQENISLEEAAKMCNISRTYFSSIFKKETGENFTYYLNRTKMEKARDLIAFHNLRVSEAAYQVGILDESYFGKLFRRHIGVNPSQIKRSLLSSSSNPDNFLA